MHQKHVYANYDKFALNFGMVFKTIQRVFVSNFKLFGPIKIKLWDRIVGEFFLFS